MVAYKLQGSREETDEAYVYMDARFDFVRILELMLTEFGSIAQIRLPLRGAW